MIFGVKTDAGTTLIMGLKDVASKSAEDEFETFKKNVEEIGERFKKTNSQKAKEIFAAISGLMSDRAATEKKFGSMLEGYVNEIAPLVRETSTSELEEEDLTAVIKLNRYFCGYHSLAHFADKAVSSGLAAEKEILGEEGAPILNPSFKQKNESAAARLVRTLSKAISRGGDEKSGIHAKAKTFLSPMLKERYNLNVIPIKNYLGSRFNILFSNAAYIYVMRKELTELFETYDTNQLLLSVKKDIQNKVILSGVQTLAMIHKTVIGPLTRALDRKENGIIEMNAIYKSLVDYLDRAAADPSILLQGSSPFAEEYLTRDQVWEEIFRPNPELAVTTRTIAASTMKSFAVFARKEFSDHIEGGAHHNISETAAKAGQTHNMVLERGLGQYDNKKRRVPGMSSAAVETAVLVSQNHTLSWLMNKPQDERDSMIRECQQQTPLMMVKNKENAQQLQKVLESRQQQLQQEKSAKEQREADERSILVKKVQDTGGLWQSNHQMSESLVHIPSKKLRLEAIKAQLCYRKKILRQAGGQVKDFSFSENGRQLSEEELKSKVASLMTNANNPVEPDDDRMSE